MLKFKKIEFILIILYILRLIVCIIPQNGYIHPDEFFQFTEPMAVHIANIKGHLTWEWKNEYPIRSIFFPFLIMWPILKLINLIFTQSICSYLILVLPRIVFAICSFITDYAIYKCCLLCKIGKIKEIMAIFASSYIVFTYLTHTFSNSIEVWLFALLLKTVLECMKNKKNEEFFKISLILTLGIWNRSTFILYSIYPIYSWTKLKYHKFRKFSGNFNLIAIRLTKLFIISLFLSIILILIDTLFYKSDYVFEILSSKELLKFDFKELVVTPLNFISFNIKRENLVKFGINAFYHHILFNFQLLFGICGAFLFYDLYIYIKNNIDYKNIKSKNTTYFKNIYRSFLFLSILPPIILFSFFPHQEPRFLIPLLFPLIILYASKHLNSKLLITFWITFNFILTIFYGHIHQAGVTKSIFSLKTELNKTEHLNYDINIIYVGNYLIPQHLFGLKENQNYNKKIFIHDLSFNDQLMENLYEKLNNLKSNQIIYIVSSSTLKDELNQVFDKLNLEFSLFKQIYFTFNFEYFKFANSFKLNDLKEVFSTNILMCKL